MSKWLIVACILLASLAFVASAQDANSAEKENTEEAAVTPAPTVSTPKRKPRSILQACRKELPTLCKDRKDAMRCLAAKADQVQDAVCGEWLNARATCNKFLKENNKCTAQQNARVCLRNIAKEELPSTCAETDYYRSVKLFGAFRRRTRLPRGESKSA